MMMLNIFSDSRFKIKETYIDRNDEDRNKTFYSGDLMAWTFGFQVQIFNINVFFSILQMCDNYRKLLVSFWVTTAQQLNPTSEY